MGERKEKLTFWKLVENDKRGSGGLIEEKKWKGKEGVYTKVLTAHRIL